MNEIKIDRSFLLYPLDYQRIRVLIVQLALLLAILYHAETETRITWMTNIEILYKKLLKISSLAEMIEANVLLRTDVANKYEGRIGR